jgi:hypothetical protein
MKKSPRSPIDFYGGVTCSFNLGVARSCASFSFNISLIIGLVCTYNLTMDFVFYSRVEEYSTICQRLESIFLLLFEATMMIMFFLVAIERLLKILSLREEMRGKNVYSGVARNLQTDF